MSKNYRKVYERYYQCSLLPGIDVHHIDGDHNNNSPSNLIAVTLQEHYNIHKSQDDHYACVMIAQRMEHKPEDWIELARINGRKSAYNNKNNSVGLTAWRENNPTLAKQACSAGGKVAGNRAAELGTGIHSLSEKEKKIVASKGGKKAAELGLGFRSGYASAAGKIGGKKGGRYAKKNQTGIFAMTPDQIRERNAKAALTKLVKNGKACYTPWAF